MMPSPFENGETYIPDLARDPVAVIDQAYSSVIAYQITGIAPDKESIAQTIWYLQPPEISQLGDPRAREYFAGLIELAPGIEDMVSVAKNIRGAVLYVQDTLKAMAHGQHIDEDGIELTELVLEVFSRQIKTGYLKFDK